MEFAQEPMILVQNTDEQCMIDTLFVNLRVKYRNHESINEKNMIAQKNPF